MKGNVYLLLYFIALFVGYSESTTVFRFANIYGSNMVLQKAPRRARIWGFGEVGREVFLTAALKWYRTEVKQGPNNTGIWSVTLRPQRYGGPYVIKASSYVNAKRVTATLKNVMFGDVWVCSGQSNMEMSVRTTTNGENAILDSRKYSKIRLFTVEWSFSKTPLSELTDIRQPWSVASPESVGGKGNLEQSYFSATCYYYGVQLHKKLKYPIGLVAASWFGTPIEFWSSPDALQQCNMTEDVMRKEGFARLMLPRRNMNAEDLKPSFLWNAMMHPFTRMTIYGVIWYQGETNAFFGLNPYDCIFPAMIDDWRAKWFQNTGCNTEKVFPFGFVQLSAVVPLTAEPKFAPLRWNQTARFGFVPNDRQKRVFMAVAMDLGNRYSPFDSAHPTNKEDVGKRLALSSFSIAYGRNVYHTGPLVSRIIKQRQRYLNVFRVTFRSVYRTIEVRNLTGFEVLCKKSKKWITAKITNVYPKSLIIRPSMNCEVQAVRYAWSDFPCIMKECAVYSGNLPSPPFIKYGPFENIYSWPRYA